MSCVLGYVVLCCVLFCCVLCCVVLCFVSCCCLLGLGSRFVRLGGVLGGFFVVLGGLWGVLAASWGIGGASWGVLAASWRVLAASWGLFGASWAVLGRHGSIFVVFSSTRWGAGAQRLPKRDPTWHPKWEQKRTKIDIKNEDEKRHSLRSSSSDLGAILGRSWAASISKIVLSPRAGLVFLKLHVFEKVGCLEATWAELEPT